LLSGTSAPLAAILTVPLEVVRSMAHSGDSTLASAIWNFSFSAIAWKTPAQALRRHSALAARAH